MNRRVIAVVAVTIALFSIAAGRRRAILPPGSSTLALSPTRSFAVTGEAGPSSRYQTSDAMNDVFIPNRMRILRDFLLSGKPPEHSN